MQDTNGRYGGRSDIIQGEQGEREGKPRALDYRAELYRLAYLAQTYIYVKSFPAAEEGGMAADIMIMERVLLDKMAELFTRLINEDGKTRNGETEMLKKMQFSMMQGFEGFNKNMNGN